MFDQEKWNEAGYYFSIAVAVLSLIFAALLFSGCGPQTVDEMVNGTMNGTVIEQQARTWMKGHTSATGETVIDKPAVFPLLVDVNGKQSVYWMDPESWCKAWAGDTIQMQCVGKHCSGLIVTRHFWEGTTIHE